MTFFIRKAFSFLGGLLRLNLSKSGPGVSVGLKGLRVGVKRDGRTYVMGGRGGLYFRESLEAASKAAKPPASAGLPAPTGQGPVKAGGPAPTGPILDGSSLRRAPADLEDPLFGDAVALVERGPIFRTKRDLVEFLRQGLPGVLDGRIGFSRAWVLADALILKAVHTPGDPLRAKLDAVFASEAVAARDARLALSEKKGGPR